MVEIIISSRHELSSCFDFSGQMEVQRGGSTWILEVLCYVLVCTYEHGTSMSLLYYVLRSMVHAISLERRVFL